MPATGRFPRPVTQVPSVGSQSERPFAVVHGCLVLAVLTGGLALRAKAKADEISTAAPSAVEQFKRFISSPPVIKNLVFQQKVPMDGGARPLDGTFALSTRFEYFQAKWQTNGLLFRRINTLDDETNFAVAGQLVSWSGHKHALVEPRGELTTWNDLDPSTRGKDISIFYTSRSLLDPLREVLNMGVMYVDIGAIKWDANHFTVAARLDQEQVRVTGALFESPSQRPDHLEVCYSFPNATNRYVIRYGYGDARKSSLLPTTITNFWLKKQQNQAEREIELDEWQILDLKTQDALLPDEAFAIAPFSTQNIWVNRVYTNGGIYEWKTNGTYLLITRLDGARSIPRPPGKTATAALYSGWGTFNFLIFALMVRAKRTENNKTLKEGVLEYDIQV